MLKRINVDDNSSNIFFVNSEDKARYLSDLNEIRETTGKEAVVKLYVTKNVREVRVYAYDNTAWKFVLFSRYDLLG